MLYVVDYNTTLPLQNKSHDSPGPRDLFLNHYSPMGDPLPTRCESEAS